MNKYVKLFEEFTKLNENRAEHPYGCSMVFLKYPELFKMQESIDPDDLHENGLEKEPHVTLLYGIHDGGEHDELPKEKLAEVIDISKKSLDEAVILKGVSAFENDEYDVLKFDAESLALREANKKLSDFPNSNTFPDYKPHVTIAYLKSGKAKDYIEKFKDLKDIEVEPEKIVYSRPNGSRVEEFPTTQTDESILESMSVFLDEVDLMNEAEASTAETISRIRRFINGTIAVKRNAAETITKVEADIRKTSDDSSKTQERTAKTKDPDQAKVYKAKIKKLSAEANLLQAKKRYQEAKILFADSQVELANAKLQKVGKQPR